MLGLGLDYPLSAGLPRPEMISNGAFSTDTSGWTAMSSVLSVVGGRLRVTNSAALFGRALQSFTTVIGRAYRLSYESYTGSHPPLVRVGTTASGFDLVAIVGPGSGSVAFTATTATTHISLWVNNNAAAGNYAEFDNISVR